MHKILWNQGNINQVHISQILICNIIKLNTYVYVYILDCFHKVLVRKAKLDIYVNLFFYWLIEVPTQYTIPIQLEQPCKYLCQTA